MAQILEGYNPWASLLGGIAQTAPGSISTLLQSRRQKESMQKENKTLQNLLGVDVSGLSPDIKKAFVQQHLKQKNASEQLLQKTRTDQLQKEEEQKGLKSALDWLDENYEYVGSQALPGSKNFNPLSLIPGGEIFPNPRRNVEEKRREIDATGFWAADQIFTHFNKGSVSKEKLKVIQNELAPNSKLSERAYKARVSAMRRIANLNPNISKESFDKEVDKEVKAVKKIEARHPSEERPELESFYR